ncbi:pilus assembly protein N-terminal domain-containing protein [Bradyrhizobium sp. 2TAF24]|uniref:pilus assembly protein N-terminal domain-containing protein n=1 Tax=Bradyrhizobium sp. 2TAF24 TaxID=3233011 RepID=UPI003F92FB12
MSTKSLRRARTLARSSLVAVSLVLFQHAALARNAGDQIDVVVDQAKLVKLPERVATLVVGNPLIADVTLQAGGMMVVTGKGYGATNFIALDRDGTVLLDRVIQVQGPTENLVTVYRGVDRESYSCTPICQRRITLGDGATYFTSTLEQAGTLSNQATGNATAAAANTSSGAPKN